MLAVNETRRQCFAAPDVETLWRLAARLAGRLGPGDVVALHGEPGAGKTAFVQGLAAALGIRRPVTSPTFALAAEYALPGGGLFVHLDLCRLNSPGELAAIGFQEYLDNGAVLAVEWAERAGDLLPPDALHVAIRQADDAGEGREVSFWREAEPSPRPLPEGGGRRRGKAL